MNIWLDDERKATLGYIHVHNLEEFKNVLKTNSEPIEIMSFDFFLGDGVANGLTVMQWLEENHLDRWPERVRAHSSNLDACRKLLEHARSVETKRVKNKPER